MNDAIIFEFETPAAMTEAALREEAAAQRQNHAAAEDHGEWHMAQVYWQRGQALRAEMTLRRQKSLEARAEMDQDYAEMCTPDPALPCVVTGEPGETNNPGENPFGYEATIACMDAFGKGAH